MPLPDFKTFSAQLESFSLLAKDIEALGDVQALVAQARKELKSAKADADRINGQAVKTLSDAKEAAVQVLAQAEKTAGQITEKASKAASELISKAEAKADAFAAQAEPVANAIAKAKQELEGLQTQIAAAKAKLVILEGDIAKARLTA